jgi:MFS family permease
MKENNRYRFVIITNIILARGCIGLIWASAGPLIPFMKQEFGISQGSAGWFASIAPLTITLLAIPAGIIGIRYSPKKTFAVGAVLQSAGILAFFCNSYIPLLLTRVSFAAGTVIVASIGSSIVAEWVSGRELPLVNGITMSVVNLANAVAFVATVPIALMLSWRAPIIIYGFLALTCAIAWIIFGKNRRKERQINTVREHSPIEMKPELSTFRALTQRPTILLALAAMGSWCLGNTIGAWLPTYYHEVFNMPLEKASSITAIITGTGVIVCILGGLLPQRIGRRKPFLIIPGVFMGLSALCAVLFNNMMVIILMVVLYGIFSSLQVPSLYTIPFELPNASPRNAAITLFAIQCGGNFGNFMGPLIAGYVTDLTGSYLPGFIISAVFSLSLLAAGLLLPETGPAARRVSPESKTARAG